VARPPRNASIDCLRGLSILLVVVHHVALRLRPKKTLLAAFVPARVLQAIGFNGYEAVFLFFVVSGFLITDGARARWGALRTIDARAFYARRAARIVPCLVALVGILALLHALGAPDYTITRTGQSLPRAALAALGLHLNWYEGQTGYLPGGWDVLWSLSIEEVFYLAFPLVCLAAKSERVLAGLAALFALTLPVTRAALEQNEIWQEKAYLPGMAGIATGVLGALVVAARPAPKRAVTAALAWTGACGIAAVLLAEDVLWPILGNGTMLVLTFSAMTLLVALRWRAAEAPAAPRGTAWLRSCGRLSYEIYLTHMFVVLAAVRIFRALGGTDAYGFVVYVPAVALSWGLGALVARFFSVPCEEATRRWLDDREQPQAAGSHKPLPEA
jgi:peptidoglycan/LPS O-acetylase OafA/YrhL